MRRLAVLLVLLAGCTSPIVMPTPPTLSRTDVLVHQAGHLLDADAPFVLRGAEFSTGMGGGEPTIGVDATGTVFVAASQGGLPVLARSRDQGRSWTAVAPGVAGVGTHARSFDRYVHVDVPTGRVFQDDLIPGCNVLSWSDDQGATWWTNPVACGNPQLDDHETVGTSHPRRLSTIGFPQLVHVCFNQVAYTSCATSVDGGRTFLPQVPILDSASGAPARDPCGASTGRLRADHEGRLFLGKTCGRAPAVYASEDDGLTWILHAVAPAARVHGHDVELAVDEDGGLYAVWNGQDGLVWLARSNDHARTWSPPMVASPPPVTATMFASVAAGRPGSIAIAYVGSTIPGGYENKPSGVGGLEGQLLGEPDPPEWKDATWNGYLTVTTTGRDASPVFQTVSVNPATDPLARGLCGRTRCHGMQDFLDVALDPDGRPWASFIDVCTKACVTDADTHWDTTTTVAGTLLVGPALRGGEAVLAELAATP